MISILLLSNNQEFKDVFKKSISKNSDIEYKIYFSPFDVIRHIEESDVHAILVDPGFPEMNNSLPETILQKNQTITNNRIPIMMLTDSQDTTEDSRKFDQRISFKDLKKLFKSQSMISKMIPGKKMILAIDNDQDFIMPLTFRLEKLYGYRVKTAPSAEEGIEFAKKHKPALILLDINMGGMSGLDACQILREDSKTSNIPVIFLSSNGSKEDIKKGFERGAADYVVKPYTPNVLLSSIENALKLKKEHKAQKSILIIDDSEDIIEVLSLRLKKEGYTILSSLEGKEGLKLALNEKPDLIICDIILPDIDGHEILKTVKKIPHTSNIPFIFLSGKTTITDINEGYELGSDHYITKPYDPKLLMDKIKELLDS